MAAPDFLAHLDKQLAERGVLSQRLADIVKKRDDYMAAERSKKPTRTADSFDRAVETTLRAQIR